MSEAFNRRSPVSGWHMTVRELLSDPQKWTTKTMARDAKGEPVSALSNDAVCWCVLGAIDKCYGDEDDGPGDVAYQRVRDALLSTNPTEDRAVSFWQDKHTHAEVLDLVTRAGI